MSRAVHSFVRLFWGVAATLLILLAVLVQTGRSSSFLVADYRQDLADYWSQKLQLQVEIGELTLHWQSLRPELIALDVRASTLQGENVAHLQSTRVELLLLPSLFQLQPVVADLQVEGVTLDFLQQSSGRWSLRGLPLTENDADEAAASNTRSNPFNAFLFGRHVTLGDANLNFTFRNGQSFTLQVPEISLENSRDFHRLSLRMDIGDRKDMVTLVVEGEGDPRDQDDFISRGYLRILQLPMNKVVSAFSKKGLLKEGFDLTSNGMMDIELWLQGSGDGFEWSGRLDASDLPSLGETAPGIAHLGANLQGFWKRAGDWQLTLHGAEIDWLESIKLDFQLSSKGHGHPLNILIERLPLAELSRLAQVHLPGDGKAVNILERLNARGELRNANVIFPLDAPTEFTFAAELDQVAVDALGGAPALTQVDGYLYADKSGGRVELDSRRGFGMQYNIYAEAMTYSEAYGEVAWHLRPDENAIIVNSSQLSLRGEDGAAEGYLYLDMPWEKGSRDSLMTLQIGLTDSDAKYHSKYVPEVVPPTLHQWLDNSLDKGRINWAGFIYRGSLAKTGSERRTIQLALDVEGGSLDYHPRWPALSGISGLLTLDDEVVSVGVEEAQIYNSQISNALVKVAPNDVGEGMLLEIDSQLQGPAEDGLKVLRDTMLRDTLGDGFDHWQLNGEMSADLALSIPLNGAAAGAKQSVNVDLDNSSLVMQSLGLEIQQLSGELSFTDDKGLAAKSLKGDLFGEPFSAAIHSNQAKKTTRINAQGRANSAEVAAWLKRPELMFVEGVLPFDADLTLFSEASERKAQLKISSNLLGAKIDIPEPFGKSAGDKRPLNIDIDMRDTATHYRINYHDTAQFELRQSSKGGLPSIALGLQQSAGLPKTANFNISGSVEHFDFLQWRDTYSRYQVFSDAINAAEELAIANGELAESTVESDLLSVAFDVHVDHFALADFNLDNISASGEYIEHRWAINLDSSVLKGRLLAHDDARPLQVDLDYLRLSQATDAVVESEPDTFNFAVEDVLAGVDPLDLPPMDFSTDELLLGTEDYGNWRFSMRPSNTGLVFDSIFATVKGLVVAGQEKAEGARLVWDGLGKNAFSQFDGVLSSADLSSTLAQFQQPGLIDSEKARFVASLGWQGSPAAISLTKLKGQLDLEVRDGRFLREGNEGNNPMLRLLGVLNFDTLLRRLKLDFSDMYKSGMVFDRIEGEMQFAEGNLYLETPLKVRTPSSRLQLAGTIDLNNETLDTSLVAALPVASPLALLAALTAGFPVAAGVYVVGKVFEEQVDKLTSVSYHISGDWADPEIKFGKIFDAKAAKRSAKKAQKDNSSVTTPVLQ